MFYEKQPLQNREDYKEMLMLVGSLSNLFSDSPKPAIHYRAHENLFCKYFDAKNLAREDCSADAKKGNLGVGLKTWVGRNNQKVAEFGRLRPEYEGLKGLDLVKKIAFYRNERIRITKKTHNLDEMIYHILKRTDGAMQIYETTFDMIDIDNIQIDDNRGSANTVYFTDGKHTYNFNLSKNTLYMIFDDMVLLDSFDVDILDDPFSVIKKLMPVINHGLSAPTTHFKIESDPNKSKKTKPQLCLRLYSTKLNGEKYVPEKSGLNQWNGARTSYYKSQKTGKTTKKEYPRNENEFYIPFPAEDRKYNVGFFPKRDLSFKLLLPDGQWISAKVCQDDGKAIMSNPNHKLGKWLLRDVFNLPIGEVVTYNMLKIFGIDSVIFTKLEEGKYSIDFCGLGTYEKFHNYIDRDMELDNKDIDKDENREDD